MPRSPRSPRRSASEPRPASSSGGREPRSSTFPTATSSDSSCTGSSRRARGLTSTSPAPSTTTPGPTSDTSTTGACATTPTRPSTPATSRPPAPLGATEYVDLRISSLAGSDARWAIPIVSSYNDIAFELLDDAFAGFAAPTRADARFDPGRGAQRFDLRGNALVLAPMVIGLTTREKLWADANLSASGYGHNVNRYRGAVGHLGADLWDHFAQRRRPTMLDVVDWHTCARADHVLVLHFRRDPPARRRARPRPTAWRPSGPRPKPPTGESLSRRRPIAGCSSPSQTLAASTGSLSPTSPSAPSPSPRRVGHRNRSFTSPPETHSPDSLLSPDHRDRAERTTNSGLADCRSRKVVWVAFGQPRSNDSRHQPAPLRHTMP